MFTIRVTEPRSKLFVEWTSATYETVIAQARLEAKRGAHVTITKDGAKLFERPRPKK